MICKLCGTCCRQIENRDNWKKSHCARCHYLGLRAAFGYRGKLKVKPIVKWGVNLAAKLTTIQTKEWHGKISNFVNLVLKFIIYKWILFNMAKINILKKITADRICKYCLISFGEKIEMYQSQRHLYFICQPCFYDRQEKRLTIWPRCKSWHLKYWTIAWA